MKKYLVAVCQPMWTYIAVEAENADEAEGKTNDLMGNIPFSEFTDEGERYVLEACSREIESYVETEYGIEWTLKE